MYISQDKDIETVATFVMQSLYKTVPVFTLLPIGYFR